MANNYRRWLYALVVLLTLIAALYLSGWLYGALRACGNILALYFTAWLLQFFFTPVVDLLTRYRVPRVLSVSYVYLILTLGIVIVAVAAVPPIVSQGQQLTDALRNKQTYEIITSTTNGIETFLRQHGVPQKDIAAFTKNYGIDYNLKTGAYRAGDKLQGTLRGYLNASNLTTSTSTFVSFVTTTWNLILDAIIVLILAFYMTLDGHKLVRRALAYFPPAASEIMEEFHQIINRKFGGYLRGQVILAASYGVLTFAIVQGFNLPYTGFIAFFAAVMMLIPFIGTVIAIVPPLVFFVFSNVNDFSLLRFLLLLALLIASQQVVINMLAPRVLSSAVGMHPLLVILGLLLGTKVAGLWGAIFGVPVFGVFMETADLIYRRVMAERYHFRPPASDESDGESARPHPSPSPRRADPVDEAVDVEAERRDKPPAALPRVGAALKPPARPRGTRS